MTTTTGALARVAFFTEHACLVAGLAVGERRVLDLLNQPTVSTLSLIDPVLARPEALDEPLGAFASGRLRKQDVLCAAVLEEPERPVDRRFAAYVAKAPVRVLLLLRSLMVVGTVHITGRGDPLDLLVAWPEPFLPLTEAGLLLDGSVIPDGQPPEPLTILINRAHVAGAVPTAPVADGDGAPHERTGSPTAGGLVLAR
jgi:hypothetical protein